MLTQVWLTRSRDRREPGTPFKTRSLRSLLSVLKGAPGSLHHNELRQTLKGQKLKQSFEEPQLCFPGASGLPSLSCFSFSTLGV
jgi:hypothetical protein